MKSDGVDLQWSRRIRGTAGIAVIAACGLLGSLVAPAAADDWPQFRGPRRDGLSKETGLARGIPESGPKILWRVPLGDGYSGMSVVGERLLTLFSDGSDEYAVALDAASGAELWRHRLDRSFSNDQGDGPRSTPTVHDGVVYALSGRGRLAALALETGKPLWEVDLTTRVGARTPRWGVSTSPLVEEDLLILDGGGKNGASIVALDRRTGLPVWTSQDDIAGYSSPIAIAAGGLRQVLVFTGRQIVSVAPADGALLWQRSWKTDWDVNAATPVFVAPNKVFVSSGYNTGSAMLQLDRTGEDFEVRTLWESRRMKNQFSTSVLHAGHLYGFDNSILKCLRAIDGEECWKARGFGHGSLIYADGMLIVLGDRGKLALVEASPDGYVELGSVQALTGKSWTAPTLSDGVVFLRNQKVILALDLRN